MELLQEAVGQSGGTGTGWGNWDALGGAQGYCRPSQGLQGLCGGEGGAEIRDHIP